jgi:hypothetical protein
MGGASDRSSLRSRMLDRSSARHDHNDSGGSPSGGASSESRRRLLSSSGGSKPSLLNRGPDGGSSGGGVKKKRPDAPGALGSNSAVKGTSVSGKASAAKTAGRDHTDGSNANHSTSRKAKNPYRN